MASMATPTAPRGWPVPTLYGRTGNGGTIASVLSVVPPYRAVTRHPSLAGLDSSELGPGAVVGFEVPEPMPSPDLLAELVATLRRRVPSAPVVLWVRRDAHDVLRIATVAARLPIRGLLVSGEPLQSGLRALLASPDPVPRDAVEWLVHRGVRLSPMVSYLLSQIFALAPAHPDLSSLLAQIGMARSSARFRCRKKGLPAPSRWFQLARALHASLRIQAEPETPLATIARRLGYADHSALSHQLHRAFGVRPRLVRDTLGWEWLMERWIGRHMRNSPSLSTIRAR